MMSGTPFCMEVLYQETRDVYGCWESTWEFPYTGFANMEVVEPKMQGMCCIIMCTIMHVCMYIHTCSIKIPKMVT